MHRKPHRCLWGVLLLLGGCAQDEAGTGPGNGLPDGDLIATIVRVLQPDDPFWIIPVPPDPAPATSESGAWSEAAPNDYRDESVFAVVGKDGSFQSLETGAAVPILVQVGSSSAGASVRVAVDQARGTIGVFGLADHTVSVTIEVYRLRGG